MTADPDGSPVHTSDTTDIRQMSFDKFYDTYIKPYAVLFLVLKFVVMPAILLIGCYILGNWPAWVIPMIFVYLLLNIASLVIRGRSIGGIRVR